MYKYSDFLSEPSKKIIKKLASSDRILHKQIKFFDTITFNFHAVVRRKVANKFFHDNSGSKEEVSNIKSFDIRNIYDDHKIRARMYEPLKKTSKEVVLFIHGGGWVQGDLETHDILCRKITNTLHRAVISVDYRLSPEYKFPIPLNDVLSAYLWCVDNGYKDIILCGDSVGGNLCAGLCIKLNSIGCQQLPASQILFYPILSNNLESKSFDLFGQGYGLTTEWTKNYIYQYTGAEYNDTNFTNNKFVYPLLAEAEIFPKTLLVSASCDVLLDDQLAFATKLKSAGIPFHQIILDGSVHGFMTYGKYFDENIDSILTEIYNIISL